MAFSNDVVGGTTLLRPAIQSPNYVPGVSGWTINRDGTSEFAGGTFRGPVVVIDPSTGVVLASIGADGNISAQNYYATGDVIIGTLSVLAAITAAPRGVVARFSTTGSLPNVPGGNVLADIAWVGWNVDPTRMYRFHCTGGRLNNTNGSLREDFITKLIVAQSGGLSATIVSDNITEVQPGQLSEIRASGITAAFTVAGPATVKLQMSNDSASTAYPIVTSDTFHLVVEDIGPVVGSGGGSGSPSGTNQFTTKYFCTASQSYDSSGNRIASPDGVNNMYQGSLSGRPSGYGTEFAVWSFPGSTIRSDLTGATIQSAKLWMYCTNSSGASGGSYVAYNTNTAPATSYPSGPTENGGANFTSAWPVPGWGSIALDTSQITGNGANSIVLDHSIIAGSASFYGFGTTAFMPYLEITYTK